MDGSWREPGHVASALLRSVGPSLTGTGLSYGARSGVFCFRASPEAKPFVFQCDLVTGKADLNDHAIRRFGKYCEPRD